MNPVAVAIQGKGVLNAPRRIGAISRRYGLTPGKMDRALTHFAGILARFNCGATFPITGAAMARTRGVVEKYRMQNIEFAVHGHHHVDHIPLSPARQLADFAEARRLFAERGVACQGFRSPYLRWSEDTIAAIKQAGFLYDSSQGLVWDVVDGGVHTDAYRRVLAFYGAVSATDCPSLPRWDGGLVRIPYSLPDDEALVERFHFRDTATMSRPWLAVLEETHRLGELFTLGLHPERIYLCEQPLTDLLQAAGRLSPGVWIARLDEMARWWVSRTETEVAVDSDKPGGFSLGVRGPRGVTILARGVEAVSPAVPWDDFYRRALGSEFRFRAYRRPFIGVSISSAPELVNFLRQQGYIVEQATDGRNHTCFLDRPRFRREDERPLLAQLEQGDFPLVRLGRWPNGTRSALCITGDIDALTLWDYNLRFLGR